MLNYGIQWVKTADLNTFTSDTGLRLRKLMGGPLRFIMRSVTKRKLVIEDYPQLKKGVPYIFASTHHFDEDIICGLACQGRNVYLLNGATQQIEHNPQMYAAWLNGMIYVNRMDPQSRRDSMAKMERVIRAGTSVLIFPEGAWNDTEHLPVMPLFPGVYTLAKNTGAQIVPISTFCEDGAKVMYFNGGEPIDVTGRDQEEVLRELRDSMATMTWRSMERHTTPISRADLRGDIRRRFMEQRKREYLRAVFVRDSWEEELTMYRDRDHPAPSVVWSTFQDVAVTRENAALLAPIPCRAAEDERYDFKRYMHENWNK